MARAGDTVHRLIRLEDAAGAAVTGAVIGDFTVTAYARSYSASVWSTYTHNAALTEIGSGRYALSYSLPSTAGWVDFYLIPTDATRTVYDNHWSGEIETQDMDSMYGNIVRGVVLPTRGALLGSVVPGELVAYRWNTWDIPFVDSNGDPILLASNYTNFTLGVRSKDQTTTKLDASTGSPTGFVVSGTDAGILTVTWPESTGVGAADIYAHLAAGALDAVPLYWEVVANLGGDASKTVPIIRSSELRIKRREVGT